MSAPAHAARRFIRRIRILHPRDRRTFKIRKGAAKHATARVAGAARRLWRPVDDARALIRHVEDHLEHAPSAGVTHGRFGAEPVDPPRGRGPQQRRAAEVFECGSGVSSRDELVHLLLLWRLLLWRWFPPVDDN